MGTEKIKPELNGVAETMLLTFYARAQYSKSKKHAFYDAKAVELVECLDYDFFQYIQRCCYEWRNNCKNTCL